MVSAPRVEPMRQGVHLPQLSIGAELEREFGLLRHVDRVVEHDHAAMADHAAVLDELLVVERHVEQARRPVGAERAADLHRADRPAGGGAAAEALDQLAQGQAEGALDQTATA